jgi:hypothetical protein
MSDINKIFTTEDRFCSHCGEKLEKKKFRFRFLVDTGERVFDISENEIKSTAFSLRKLCRRPT